MTIADRIKALRIEQGLSQGELADRIGKGDKSTICKMEGNGDSISLKNIKKIAEALHTTPAYLMGWEDDPPKPDKELGELTVTIMKSPRLIQLVKDFIKLDREQQDQFQSLIHFAADKGK